MCFRAFACKRLPTAWCLVTILSLITLVQLWMYVGSRYRREDHYVLSSDFANTNFQQRRSELSACPLENTERRRRFSKERLPVYRCNNPKKSSAVRSLDPRKYVFARYITEINGTSIQDSNKLNLIANAIDIKGFVIHETSVLSSQCLVSEDNQECLCSCIGLYPNNCSLPLGLTNSECVNKPVRMFDLEEFQKVLCDNGLPKLMSIDSFLHNSYRDIVFVHPINKLRQPNLLTADEQQIQNRLRLDSPIIDCSGFESIHNNTQAILEDVNSLSKLFCLEQFRMSGSYCIAAWYKSNDLGMYGFADEKASIVFTSWSGLERDDSDILVMTESKEPKLDPELENPDNSDTVKPSAKGPSRNIVRRRHHSSLAKMVLQQTKKFIKSMAQGRQYIVVHIRVDETFSEYTKRTDFSFYYQSCLFKLKSHLDKLKLEHPDATVFFFMDLAADLHTGQNTSANTQYRLVQTVLLSNKYEIQHYSPEQYGGRSDIPFVSLVEQEFMCRASYLLTVGGGQIQDRLKKRFLKMHFRKKLLDFEFCDVDPLNPTSGQKYL